MNILHNDKPYFPATRDRSTSAGPGTNTASTPANIPRPAAPRSQQPYRAAVPQRCRSAWATDGAVASLSPVSRTRRSASWTRRQGLCRGQYRAGNVQLHQRPFGRPVPPDAVSSPVEVGRTGTAEGDRPVGRHTAGPRTPTRRQLPPSVVDHCCQSLAEITDRVHAIRIEIETSALRHRRNSCSVGTVSDGGMPLVRLSLTCARAAVRTSLRCKGYRQ
jgi:hypothetical protein